MTDPALLSETPELRWWQQFYELPEDDWPESPSAPGYESARRFYEKWADGFLDALTLLETEQAFDAWMAKLSQQRTLERWRKRCSFDPEATQYETTCDIQWAPGPPSSSDRSPST